MLVVLALHPTNDKETPRIKLQVPGTHDLTASLLLCLWFSFKFTCGISASFHFSSHNWNTLFLGTSAVADAIAEKYNTTKSQVLDHVSDTASCFYIFLLPL